MASQERGRTGLALVGVVLALSCCRTASPKSGDHAPPSRPEAPAGGATRQLVAAQQLGPLSFDPQGADFQEWVNGFKNAVYKNWVVPPETIEGFQGHVDVEFTVERDGSVGTVRVLTPARREAITLLSQRTLLAASPFLPLPAGFRHPRITMQMSFRYNEDR